MSSFERGASLLDLLVAVSLFAVLSAIGVQSLRALNNPLQNASAQINSYFKQTRAKAISTTSAYQVSAASPTRIVARFGTTCANATTADASTELSLPRGSRLADTTWTFCFTTRGLVDSNLTINVVDEGGEVRQVEVLVGGASRVLS